MKRLRTHGKMFALLMLAIACGVGVFLLPIEENIIALIPQTMKEQVVLFEHAPLSKKLLVIAQADRAEIATTTLEQTRDRLLQSNLIRPILTLEENGFEQLLHGLPDRFSPSAQQQIVQKISPQVIAKQFITYYEQLFSFQGFFVKTLFENDPLNFSEILTQRWQALSGNTHTVYQQGFLTNSDGTIQAGIFDTSQNTADFSTAKHLHDFFAALTPKLPPNTHVFFMGGLRYTWENVAGIQKDLKKISLVSILGLGLVFVCFFRTKRALLIYLIPLWVLPPAAFITQLFFGKISGITLGFGSVVVGLSVDYAIYTYFAYSTHAVEQEALPKGWIRKHLLCNFLTSALCFVALFCSSIEVFKQIAVFSLVALGLSLLIALYVLPDYWKGHSQHAMISLPVRLKPLPIRWASVVGILLLILGGWGIMHLSLKTDLTDLNFRSEAFCMDKQITEILFPTTRQALLFALGKDTEDALIQNEKMSHLLPTPLAVSELFISQNRRAENRERWKNFWHQNRINSTLRSVQKEAHQVGFASHTWDNFFHALPDLGKTVDFSTWYNPLMNLPDGRKAVVNIVPDEEVFSQVATGKQAVFLSVTKLQKQITHQVKQEALLVILLTLLFNFVSVWLLFKKVKETLLCFVPLVLGGSVLFGGLALLDISVNLFGLIFLPLLVGLGIDYAIFQLLKFHLPTQQIKTLYPPQALAAAGLSTLAGFGVLVFAHHAVLFMMGICALLGIGGAILAALFVLPAFLERYA